MTDETQSPKSAARWNEAGATENRSCPVCAAAGAKQALLRTPSLAPGRGTITLLKCASCTNLFWDDLEPFAYEDGNGYVWSTDFYVEQGAGVDALIEPIARLPREQVRRYLELGCGFGFSIDAAVRLFGWQCLGLDPSPLGRAGQDQLGIEIRPIYATTDIDLGGKFDFVYASEVIEHVSDPRAFLEICAAHLAPAGVLALTTPDAGSVKPDMPPAELMLALSPGHHLVLYSAEGLRHLLRDAGFTTVSVHSRGHRLIAYASRAVLGFDPTAPLDRSLYRDYLAEVLERDGLSASLRRGLRYRLLKEQTNRGDYAAAADLLAELATDIERDFGLDIAAPLQASVLDTIRRGALTGQFGAPWCLPGILYFAGTISQNGRGEPAVAVERFDAACLAARAFRAAYASIGIDDGETASFEQDAPLQALLSLCQVDPTRAISRLKLLPAASADIQQAIVFCLLDLGHLELAAEAAVDPGLKALSQGYVVLHRNGDGPGALRQFDPALEAGGAIAARARSGIPSATHQAILAATGDEIDGLIEDLFDRVRSPDPSDLVPIMVSLVDLGRFDAATDLDRRIGDFADWRLSNARAMAGLLYHKRPEAAAALFSAAWSQALEAGTDAVTKCRIKHHEVLARLIANDAQGAASAAAVILGADAMPWATKDAKADLVALLADHPQVRQLMDDA